MPLSSYERYPLLFGPSPVHRLERLTERLGGASPGPSARTATPVSRTVEQDPQAGVPGRRRARPGLTRPCRSAGCSPTTPARSRPSPPGPGSSACSCRRAGWTGPTPVYDKVGNILISRLAGADVRLVKAGFGIGFKESWEQALREVEEGGGKPYAIPAGASDHPLGGLGFAAWAHEVVQQERELGVFFDTVVVCSVTGSTQAGMVAGFAALEETGGRPLRAARHRRLGQAGRHPHADRPHRPEHRAAHRPQARADRVRHRTRRAVSRGHLRHP
ncbi:aminocyclopropane-1-carboxylate deaminase/D-cysteine desulfhydrase family protein [Streptomyces purpurascens]